MQDLESFANLLIKPTYVRQGLNSLQARKNDLRLLLETKMLPRAGLSESTIEFILHELSAMDSNNFSSNIGVGEREGRVFSPLVARRHYHFAHGIGRSDDLNEVQPKAAGSSLLYVLTNHLTRHALRVAGLKEAASHCLVVPMATGMTLALSMLSLKKARPAGARYVIWSRIDQKSCFKSILTAGLTPLIVENILDSEGGMVTNLPQIDALITQYGADSIVCVLATTSCFAPRQPDAVDEIAVLCARHGIPHVVNNAYGLQCKTIVKLLNRALVKGRLDVVVQSTDKNFMVPVGGAIVASANKDIIQAISSTYSGRASSTPVLDLFMTLLAMGEDGYRRLLQERETLWQRLQKGLGDLARRHEEVLLPSPRNCISIAMSLRQLRVDPRCSRPLEGKGEAGEEEPAIVEPKLEAVDVGATPVSAQGSHGREQSGEIDSEDLKPSFLGSMLFQRNVSGCRVVNVSSPQLNSLAVGGEPGGHSPKKNISKIGGYVFENWGAHHDAYPTSYLTAACALGACEEEITEFLRKLESCILKYKRR